MKYSTQGFEQNSTFSQNPFDIPPLPAQNKKGFEEAPVPGTIANNFNQCSFCYASLSTNFTLALGGASQLIPFDTFSTNTNGMGETSSNGIRIKRDGYYIITVGVVLNSDVVGNYAFDMEVNGVVAATDGLNPYAGRRLGTINAILYLKDGDLITSKAIGDSVESNLATFIRVIEFGNYAV